MRRGACERGKIPPVGGDASVGGGEIKQVSISMAGLPDLSGFGRYLIDGNSLIVLSSISKCLRRPQAT